MPSCFMLLFLATSATLTAQESVIIGEIRDAQTKKIVTQVEVLIGGTQEVTHTDENGKFLLPLTMKGDYILTLSATNYLQKKIPLVLEGTRTDLGVLFIEPDIILEQKSHLISLSEADLQEEQGTSYNAGILQSSKDIFLNRAAFDFGQAFFRVRGYDSENGSVLLNGFTMNKFYDGRPQWNNWGGLNDVTRNQEFSHGLQRSEYSFGGILGTTNMAMRPSGLRKGARLSGSISNRTYTGRIMATYNSGLQENNLVYAISASRRWAGEGYIDGTLYDAFSLFGSLEYILNERHSVVFTTLLASNRRGRSSAISEEVFKLTGNRYNPYWGTQNGEIRNSRERKIEEPIVMLNHYYKSKKIYVNTGIAYQFGSHTRSRLGYYNAPNPDPTYYRYLPSFYINSPIGANFISANTAKEAFTRDPQINWPSLYQANLEERNSGKASYVLYDDVVQDRLLNLNTILNYTINDHIKFDLGINYRSFQSDNFAEIKDLLGAEFHEDIDPFSDTANDASGSITKTTGAVFNYNYRLDGAAFGAFAQIMITARKWEAFATTKFTTTTYQREGLFLNERFPESSIGKGPRLKFSGLGFKGGVSYKFNGRHWLSLNAGLINKPPTVQNVFINPRENGEVVSNSTNERITTTDINYNIRLSQLKGRLTGFYTRFQDATDINFFFVDAGIGSEFVQEVVTDLDKLHLGVELGLEYKISPSVNISAVAAIGKYEFASDPDVQINFLPDTVNENTQVENEQFISTKGVVDLGIAQIKDLRLAQGPQQAFALGISYRDPTYWWVGISANYLSDNYANISTITRTQSFRLNPETGLAFPEATPQNIQKLLTQKPLDEIYLLNLVAGKSWLINNKYISVFASINNAFDQVFRTGGYEQSRNGNYGQLAKDNLAGNPSFPPKYWYGYGRTFFLNVAFSFQ